MGQLVVGLNLLTTGKSECGAAHGKVTGLRVEPWEVIPAKYTDSDDLHALPATL